MRRVLVLGRDGRSTLSIIRSLGRAGIAVDLGWALPGDIPAASRYVRRRVALPFPTAANWLAPLEALLAAERYALVIPSSDMELLPLLIHRERLEPLARLAIPSTEAFGPMFDKVAATQLADELGLPQPPWRVVRPGDDLAAVELPVPCVLKPSSSFELNKPTVVRRKVRLAFDAPAARAALAEMTQDGPVIVQAFFAGRGVGVSAIARDGEILSAIQHARLHEAPEGSGSSYRVTERLDPALLDAARRVVARLNCTGPIMLEFKRNDRGEWVFIEINGRFWGSLPLAIAAGFDAPYDLYRVMVEGATSLPQRYRQGARGRNLTGEVEWFVRNWRADHTNRNLITTSKGRSLLAAARALLPGDHVDTFTFDDPGPLWAELRTATLRLNRRFPPQLTAATLRQAHSVLVLCKGNICRSPFAEQRLQVRWPNLMITSAGTYLEEGRPSPDTAIRAARAFGVDLAGHRSRIATPEALADADVVLTFDRELTRWLDLHFPALRPKVFALGAEIADPDGRESDMEPCYRTIAERIARLSNDR